MDEIKDTKIKATVIGFKDSKGEPIKQIVADVEIPIHQVVSKLMKDTNKYLYVDHITNTHMTLDEIAELKLRTTFEDDEYHFYLVNGKDEIELEFE
jgi:hypothetical protein|nr:MAG TPA: hypothetical protein [Caudoviricetes sp.]